MLKKWWLVGALTVVLGIILAGSLFKRDPLKVELVAMKKAGLPTTYAELSAMSPHTGTEATPFYEEFDEMCADTKYQKSDQDAMYKLL